MDRYDKQILELLQRNAELPLLEIAERVGLSKNPCWRRIRKLQESGIIKQKVALLNPAKLNVAVTVFINVRTNQHSNEWLEAFSSAVADIPEIVEFYRMSGDVDYILKAVVPNVEAFDRVYKTLISKVDIFEVSSHFAMEELKNTTQLPLDYLT
ncbi:MAG: Lrp/AsnC family transcriptional regulator [Pseudomonadota bacterium]